MLSLRNLARAAPRSVARLSTKTARPQFSLLRTTSVCQPSWTQSASRLGASFHTSSIRRQEIDNAELVAKLQSEISIEEETRTDEQYSSNVINDYLENSPFTLEETAGQEEVVLSRQIGDETIRVAFTTADLTNENQEREMDDQAMYDEEEGVEDIIGQQSGGANSKGAANQGRTANGNVKVAPEDSVSPADRPELDDEVIDEDEPRDQSFAARANIRIERPGRGALAIEAVAQDGDFVIENIFYFPEADLADPKTAEKDWERRNLYTGPPFGNLDEDLQILLEKYLEERGINTRMALFIPDYIDYKEQKEYLRWLGNVKNFVDA
ncbi:mitochondrial glyco protein [Mytilinidion resinicola]|uniref:Mitochondrial glyco protein n=1 Tax=Mytilinidion resinicola TaxID=574789 RepID=A0A6A6Z1W6_9PEZI|nr:mitochondrial glyco protein [Mytilinidion resinicola]KAF2814284.1 mitochondrial glyco protein [Mytilinidion resinicola]